MKSFLIFLLLCCSTHHILTKFKSEIKNITHISTSAAKRFLREALEIGGSNRILWGCDTWTSEESYGAVLAFRRVVSEVLSEMCQEGYLSCEEACYTAGQIWRGNALKLFGFED